MRMRRFLVIILLVSVVPILRQNIYTLMHTAMMDVEFIPPTQFFSLPSETAAGNNHRIEIKGRGKGEEEEEGDPPVCKMRDLSEYTKYEATEGQKLSPSRTKKLKNAKCLSFRCNKNLAPCDNGLPTNYDGPEPPCCIHILRDMARIFDDTMCGLCLEYISTFGTLLGLVRSDRLIPWTSDNDYIIPSNAMVDLWDTRTTGMTHHFEKGLNRICVTGDFAGGELKEKWEDEWPLLNWSDENTGPYMDFYIGWNVTDQMYKPLPECKHLYRDVFPTKRVYVYNRTFATNMPANPDQLLRTMYGRNWRKPRANKSVHGGGPPCPYSLTLSL